MFQSPKTLDPPFPKMQRDNICAFQDLHYNSNFCFRCVSNWQLEKWRRETMPFSFTLGISLTPTFSSITSQMSCWQTGTRGDVDSETMSLSPTAFALRARQQLVKQRQQWPRDLATRVEEGKKGKRRRMIGGQGFNCDPKKEDRKRAFAPVYSPPTPWCVIWSWFPGKDSSPQSCQAGRQR